MAKNKENNKQLSSPPSSQRFYEAFILFSISVAVYVKKSSTSSLVISSRLSLFTSFLAFVLSLSDQYSEKGLSIGCSLLPSFLCSLCSKNDDVLNIHWMLGCFSGIWFCMSCLIPSRSRLIPLAYWCVFTIWCFYQNRLLSSFSFHYIVCLLLQPQFLKLSQISLGEWNFLATAFSLLSTDFLSRYVFHDLPSSSVPSFLAVSYAGVLGTLWSCMIPCKVSILVKLALLVIPYIFIQISLQGTLPLSWILSFLSSTENESRYPRAVCLFYWVFVLILFLPFSVYLSRKQHLPRTVLRKFFHLVAICLFFPVTTYFPQTMAFSYAVAISLLIFLESLRQSLPETSAIQVFYQSFKKKEEDVNGIILSHIALILGCAIPLWAQCILSEKHLLLPYLGIIVLGVGDSMGALIGTYYGKTPWCQNHHRTVQGSFAMFLGMIFAVLICFGMDATCDTWRVWLILTLLEAFTDFDNLCLPIAGVSCILLAS